MKILIPILLGVAAVAQAGLNRRMSVNLGLAQATLLNNSVLLVASLAFVVCARMGQPQKAPGGFAGPAANSGAPALAAQGVSPLMYVLPGLLGIAIVAGVPWAMAQWGATTVFIGLMASQIVGSVLWDVLIEARAVSGTQIASASLVVASVALMMRGTS